MVNNVYCCSGMVVQVFVVENHFAFNDVDGGL